MTTCYLSTKISNKFTALNEGNVYFIDQISRSSTAIEASFQSIATQVFTKNPVLVRPTYSQQQQRPKDTKKKDTKEEESEEDDDDNEEEEEEHRLNMSSWLRRSGMQVFHDLVMYGVAVFGVPMDTHEKPMVFRIPDFDILFEEDSEGRRKYNIRRKQFQEVASTSKQLGSAMIGTTVMSMSKPSLSVEALRKATEVSVSDDAMVYYLITLREPFRSGELDAPLLSIRETIKLMSRLWDSASNSETRRNNPVTFLEKPADKVMDPVVNSNSIDANAIAKANKPSTQSPEEEMEDLIKYNKLFQQFFGRIYGSASSPENHDQAIGMVLQDPNFNPVFPLPPGVKIQQGPMPQPPSVLLPLNERLHTEIAMIMSAPLHLWNSSHLTSDQAIGEIKNQNDVVVSYYREIVVDALQQILTAFFEIRNKGVRLPQRVKVEIPIRTSTERIMELREGNELTDEGFKQLIHERLGVPLNYFRDKVTSEDDSKKEESSMKRKNFELQQKESQHRMKLEKKQFELEEEESEEEEEKKKKKPKKKKKQKE